MGTDTIQLAGRQTSEVTPRAPLVFARMGVLLDRNIARVDAWLEGNSARAEAFLEKKIVGIGISLAERARKQSDYVAAYRRYLKTAGSLSASEIRDELIGQAVDCYTFHCYKLYGKHNIRVARGKVVFRDCTGIINEAKGRFKETAKKAGVPLEDIKIAAKGMYLDEHKKYWIEF